MNRTLFRLRVRLARRWDRLRAPWPIVGECHSDHIAEHVCEQCQPTHAHEWRAWSKAPRWVAGGPGVPIRCRRCGARKCDAPLCHRRRHDHTHGMSTRPASNGGGDRG